MKCSNCNGEWTAPQNMKIKSCPFCQSDLSKIIFNELSDNTSDSVLAKIIDFYGTDILKDQVELETIINTNFSNDLRYKKLLLVSLRENVPSRLEEILKLDTNDQRRVIESIFYDLENNAFLNKDSISQIIDIWKIALKFSKEQVSNDIKIIWENGFCGIGNSNSKLITEKIYDDAIVFKDGFVAVKLNGKWGIITSSGIEITEIKYDNPHYTYDIDTNSLFFDGLARVIDKGKWGYINKSGKEVIKLKFDYEGDFSEGFAAVQKNGKWAFIDLYGNEICSYKFETDYNMYGKIEHTYFKESLAKVCFNGKYGFIDKYGNEVIEIKYDTASHFNNGTSEVRINGTYENINKNGLVDNSKNSNKWPNSNQDYIYHFILKEGVFCVSTVSLPERRNQFGVLERKYGVIDKNNKILMPFKFDNILECYKVDLVIITLNKKNGLIDLNTNEITPIKYDHIWSFAEGFARVTINKKSGYINLKGIEITKIRYDVSFDFINGIARVMINNKWGYINSDGEEIIPLKYDDINEFNEGLSVVKLNNKYGYIDQNGINIIPLKYDYALDFKDGLSSINIEGLWALINKQGKLLTQFKYDSIWGVKEDVLMVKLNDKYGFLDRNGKELTPIEFTEAENFHKGYARVKLNEDYEWSFIDKSGDIVIVSDEILKWYERFDDHMRGNYF
jgi:hypothetical protein